MAKKSRGKKRKGPSRGARRPVEPAGGSRPDAPRQEEAPVVVVQLEGTEQALVFAADHRLESYGLTKLLTAGELALPGVNPSALPASLNGAAAALNVGAQVGSALALQGLYRLGPQTQWLMSNGAQFMWRDGVRLGTPVRSGRIVKPVQLVPAGGAGAVSFLAGVGPALVLLGLQLQLGRLTQLVEGLYPLGLEAVTEVRSDRWSAVTAAYVAAEPLAGLPQLVGIRSLIR